MCVTTLENPKNKHKNSS